MMGLWQAPLLVAALVAWLTTPPGSLAEVSRKETVRRYLTASSSGTFTNDTLPTSRPSDYTAAPAADSAPAEPGSVGGEEGTPPDAVLADTSSDAAAPASPPRDEKFWRDELAGLRSAIDTNRVMADAMQTRINSLQNDLAGRDDPAQRTVLAGQLARAAAELDKLKATIARDEQAIQKLQTDARRQGVPPGWVR